MNIPLEVLEIEAMASGDLSLGLTLAVSWEEFERYAIAVVEILGATVQARADSPVERVWDISIEGLEFWLTFQDFALGVSLDARDARASGIIHRIRDQLLQWRTD